MTTVKTLKRSQIVALLGEALNAGDDTMAAYCRVALDMGEHRWRVDFAIDMIVGAIKEAEKNAQ